MIASTQMIADYLKRMRDMRDERDYEAADSAEFGLYTGVLEYIASGNCPDPVEFARLAMQATQIPFKRYRS